VCSFSRPDKNLTGSATTKHERAEFEDPTGLSHLVLAEYARPANRAVQGAR